MCCLLTDSSTRVTPNCGAIAALPIHYTYLYLTGQKAPRIKPKIVWILILPAITDLLATTLFMIGLLYVTVSVYQLVRCMVIVIVALLKVFVLKHKLTPYHWTGVMLNAIAIACVSASAFVDPNAGSNVALGIFTILLGCSLNAFQFVLEEKVMGDDDTPPLVVVGMEGLWGSLLMLFILFPAAYLAPGNDVGGSYENFWDSIVMIKNSSSLFGMTLVYLFSITGYNVSAIFVTFLLESVWRSILENFRPIAVWGTDLLLFYVFTHQTFGEAWTKWSWLELGGMGILFIGTATYNATIKWPMFKYSETEKFFPITPSGGKIANSPLIVKPNRPEHDEYALRGEKTPLLGHKR